MLLSCVCIVSSAQLTFEDYKRLYGDQARYQFLMQEFHKAPDKEAAAKEIVTELNKWFSKDDIQYFSGYQSLSATLIYTHPRLATVYSEIAITNFKENYNKFVQLVSDHLLASQVIFLAQSYASQGIHSTSLEILEKEAAQINTYSNHGQIMLYSALAWAYLETKNYTNARKMLASMNKILQSGEPLFRKDAPKTVRNIYLAKSYGQDANIRKSLQSDYESKMSMLLSRENKADSAKVFSDKQAQTQAELMASYKKPMGNALTRLGYKKGMRQFENTPEVIEYNAVMKQVGGVNGMQIMELHKQGKPAEASKLAEGAFDLAIHRMYLNDYAGSEAAFQKCLTELRKLEHNRMYAKSGEVWSDLVNQARVPVLMLLRRYSEAISLTKKSLQKLDDALENDFPFFAEEEKKEYIARFLTSNNQLMSIMLASDSVHWPSALERLLNTRGLVMTVTKDQAERIAASGDKKIQDEMLKTQRYRAKVVAFSRQLENGDPSAMDSLQKYELLVKNHQRLINEQLGHSKKVIRNHRWTDLQSKLAADETYVEIVQVSGFEYKGADEPLISNYWAFIVDQQHTYPRLIKVGSSADLEHAVRGYQNSIRAAIEDKTSYDIFWKKIATNITGKKKIIFIPDGVYHLINTSTLLNGANGRFVMDDAEVITLSAGADLFDNTKKTSDGQAVFIGNPDFTMNRRNATAASQKKKIFLDHAYRDTTRAGVAPLPGAEREVVSIEKIARQHGLPVTLLIGADATEAKIKSIDRPYILHFATHGLYEKNNLVDGYLRSKLVLAGGADPTPMSAHDYQFFEDGFLTAYEVSQMNLDNTRLVILSACETGLGDIQSGEGVWGLQRAFQMAGAQYVMASLWKISDDVTALFMKEFYASVFAGKPPREAYMTAMKKMREVYQHPFYWGAFVLLGSEK